MPETGRSALDPRADVTNCREGWITATTAFQHHGQADGLASDRRVQHPTDSAGDPCFLHVLEQHGVALSCRRLCVTETLTHSHEVRAGRNHKAGRGASEVMRSMVTDACVS